LLFESSAADQGELIDRLVERVQALGGVPTLPRQVGDLALVSRPPHELDDVADMLSRLLRSHQQVVGRLNQAIGKIDMSGDHPSQTLLKDMACRHESQIALLADYIDDDAEQSA
jgi:DNA-binding ferritin-like protein